MASKPKATKVIVYKDASGEWRWSAHSKNGRKVASSGEGYKNRMYAFRMAKFLFPTADIEWGAK